MLERRELLARILALTVGAMSYLSWQRFLTIDRCLDAGGAIVRGTGACAGADTQILIARSAASYVIDGVVLLVPGVVVYWLVKRYFRGRASAV